MLLSRRFGGAANPGGRADGNRKQRGSHLLTFYGIRRLGQQLWQANAETSPRGSIASEVCLRRNAHGWVAGSYI
jgi:hypothetical protein